MSVGSVHRGWEGFSDLRGREGYEVHGGKGVWSEMKGEGNKMVSTSKNCIVSGRVRNGGGAGPLRQGS